MFSRTAVWSLFFAGLAFGHSSPKTPAEIKEYQALQSQIYHCAPVVQAYTEARKRSWAQKMLGADAIADKNLFLEGAFDDLAGEKKTLGGGTTGLLSCEEVAETTIKNPACVLSPEVTQGPYYHQKGHPLRQNIAEWQAGLLFLMDIGVIDVETCQPIPNILIDIWHCNATGYYAGHPAPHPHLAREKPQRGGPRSGLLSAYPRTKFEETFLRGAWPTDKNGVVQFTSIFPGFYTGRATHVHVKAHKEWTTHENNSFTTDKMIYTGQLFVPDDVNLQVDKLWPYSENPLFYADKPDNVLYYGDAQGRTRNTRDSLNIFPDMHANGMQPIFEIHPLNGVLTQGLIGYMTLGLNLSNIRPEVQWTPGPNPAAG